MNELSLFSGAGGGLLGTKLLGWKHIGYVEINDYCQRIIEQRIADGFLNYAPIFGGSGAFISEGYAESYQGMVDVLSAGFVCTEISIANKKAKKMDEGISADTWQFTSECIRIIRPRYVLLENSPAILIRGFERVANDLAAMGYSFRWGVLGFNDIGGLHQRKRWWCVAADASGNGLEGWDGCITEGQGKTKARYIQVLGENKIRMDLPDPRTFGSPHDVACRVDRLKAIGNGQVPAVVKTAWELLACQK